MPAARPPPAPPQRPPGTHKGRAPAPPRRIPPMDVVILGIDPGTANTGYGVVARSRGRLVALDGGVSETTAGLDLSTRLATIHERVGALIDEHGADAVAVEDL